MRVTGTEFADILRDADMFSGFAPQYAWVRAWKTAYGIPLGTAAQEAAQAADWDGLPRLWLHACAQAFDGRYTIRAPEFARAMDEAAQAMRSAGAVLFPAVAGSARRAQTFAAWSADAYAQGLRTARFAHAQEYLFVPWLRAMCARYLFADSDRVPQE